MRLTNVGSSRPNFYDRNPLTPTTTGNQSNLVAPHGNTTRWTYTVPTARKALVGSVHASTNRETVAAPAAAQRSFVQRNAAPSSFFADAYLLNNTVGAVAQSSVSGGAIILAGDAIAGSDADASTGGTCSFQTDCLVTEFDA
jgi:hypothetical protein